MTVTKRRPQRKAKPTVSLIKRSLNPDYDMVKHLLRFDPEAPLVMP